MQDFYNPLINSSSAMESSLSSAGTINAFLAAEYILFSLLMGLFLGYMTFFTRVYGNYQSAYERLIEHKKMVIRERIAYQDALARLSKRRIVVKELETIIGAALNNTKADVCDSAMQTDEAKTDTSTHIQGIVNKDTFAQTDDIHVDSIQISNVATQTGELTIATPDIQTNGSDSQTEGCDVNDSNTVQTNEIGIQTDELSVDNDRVETDDAVTQTANLEISDAGVQTNDTTSKISRIPRGKGTQTISVENEIKTEGTQTAIVDTAVVATQTIKVGTAVASTQTSDKIIDTEDKVDNTIEQHSTESNTLQTEQTCTLSSSDADDTTRQLRYSLDVVKGENIVLVIDNKKLLDDLTKLQRLLETAHADQWTMMLAQNEKFSEDTHIATRDVKKAMHGEDEKIIDLKWSLEQSELERSHFEHEYASAAMELQESYKHTTDYFVEISELNIELSTAYRNFRLLNDQLNGYAEEAHAFNTALEETEQELAVARQQLVEANFISSDAQMRLAAVVARNSALERELASEQLTLTTSNDSLTGVQKDLVAARKAALVAEEELAVEKRKTACAGTAECTSCPYHLGRALRLARAGETAAMEMVDKVQFQCLKAWSELQDLRGLQPSGSSETLVGEQVEGSGDPFPVDDGGEEEEGKEEDDDDDDDNDDDDDDDTGSESSLELILETPSAAAGRPAGFAARSLAAHVPGLLGK